MYISWRTWRTRARPQFDRIPKRYWHRAYLFHLREEKSKARFFPLWWVRWLGGGALVLTCGNQKQYIYNIYIAMSYEICFASVSVSVHINCALCIGVCCFFSSSRSTYTFCAGCVDMWLMGLFWMTTRHRRRDEMNRLKYLHTLCADDGVCGCAARRRLICVSARRASRRRFVRTIWKKIENQASAVIAMFIYISLYFQWNFWIKKNHWRASIDL